MPSLSNYDTFSLCTPGPNGNQENKIRADNYGDCSPDGQSFAIIADPPVLSVTREG
ncbi:MAG: hypothetical protein Q9161_005009 [Pseudevernia consocians]